MGMYKDLEHRSASDFGVDPTEFQAMVATGRTADRRFVVFLGAMVGINVVLLLAFHVVAFPGVLGLWLVHWGFHARANRMAKALGITRAEIRRLGRSQPWTAKA